MKKLALLPNNTQHYQQILAGTAGRNTGHAYEEYLADNINSLNVPLNISIQPLPIVGSYQNVFSSNNEAFTLITYLAKAYNISQITRIYAVATGGLATSANSQGVHFNGQIIKKCKSDILIEIKDQSNQIHRIGISVKQCNNQRPLNAQVFCSTASGFSNLLRQHNIPVSILAENELRKFCGHPGSSPIDHNIHLTRVIDHRRYFWEELDINASQEWQNIFDNYNAEIARILLQKAYSNEPYPPEFLLHKTKRTSGNQEIAIFEIADLIVKSFQYQCFTTSLYRVKKGTFKEAKTMGDTHEAPSFGIFQMQRLGNTQNAHQLQFNLKAGYFYHI